MSTTVVTSTVVVTTAVVGNRESNFLSEQQKGHQKDILRTPVYTSNSLYSPASRYILTCTQMYSDCKIEQPESYVKFVILLIIVELI